MRVGRGGLEGQNAFLQYNDELSPIDITGLGVGSIDALGATWDFSQLQGLYIVKTVIQ